MDGIKTMEQQRNDEPKNNCHWYLHLVGVNVKCIIGYGDETIEQASKRLERIYLGSDSVVCKSSYTSTTDIVS